MRGLLLIMAAGLATLTVAAAPAGNLMRPGSGTLQPRPEERSTPTLTVSNTASATKDLGDATEVRFYGHGFLYLVSSSGVRIAFDPFPNDPRIGLPFPAGLPADIVLISAEAPELSAHEGLAGLPQVFRSLTGLGMNNANGIEFRGVATYRDAFSARERRGNTAYVMELDRVVFCNLGAVGQSLDKRQERDIGSVDVLFLPVGNLDISVGELWQIAAQTRAKWVVPVLYRTPASASAFPNLRTLEEFLAAPELANIPRVKLDASEFVFSYKKLPKETTLLIYPSP